MNEEMIDLIQKELINLKHLNKEFLENFKFKKYEDNIKNITLLFENFNNNFQIETPIFKSKAKNLETEIIFFKNNFEKELHKILLVLKTREKDIFDMLTTYVENHDKYISTITFVLNFEFSDNKTKEETLKKIQKMFEN